MTNTPPPQRFSYIALLALSIAIIASVIGVNAVQPAVFSPYFGAVSPVLAVLLICAIGFGALYVLNTRYHFKIYEPAALPRSLRIAAALAVPFMISVTIADLTLAFPEDINVPLPIALLFYPAMGYVAQTVFHILPLALLLPLVGFLFRSWSQNRHVWITIVLVTTLEAVYQAANAAASDPISPRAVFVIIHLFLFGLVELYIFRRYDFISMYAFRITYYAYWHVAWGHLRLQWIF